MKRTLVIFLAISFSSGLAWAQEDINLTSGSQFKSLIDIPTAGALHRGEYDFETRIFPNGGILIGFSVGLFDRFNMGVSFGGTDIISDSPEVNWNDQPGVEVKYRLFEENVLFPAIAFGYSSQGYGYFEENLITEEKRYRNKARGLYAVASKNFQYLPQRDLGVHGGVNFNTSERDDDESMNFFLGLDLAINEELSLLTEYDFALDDDSDYAYGEGSGYFNAGIRWTFGDHLLFQFNFKDIFSNNRYSDTAIREVKIVYVQNI